MEDITSPEQVEKEDPNTTKLTFSKGWHEKFMKRNRLMVRRCTTVAQKRPDHVIDKPCANILKVRQLCKKIHCALKDIHAMDKIAMWNDISNTMIEKRGVHTVSLKSTSHKKLKITVCLTAVANGSKKKPFIVFKGAKHKLKRLNEQFKTIL